MKTPLIPINRIHNVLLRIEVIKPSCVDGSGLVVLATVVFFLTTEGTGEVVFFLFRGESGNELGKTVVSDRYKPQNIMHVLHVLNNHYLLGAPRSTLHLPPVSPVIPLSVELNLGINIFQNDLSKWTRSGTSLDGLVDFFVVEGGDF